MSSREQFEAWYEKAYPGGLSTGAMGLAFEELAHAAWQASRQALVVKFPEEEPCHLINTIDMIKALEDAGVKFD